MQVVVNGLNEPNGESSIWIWNWSDPEIDLIKKYVRTVQNMMRLLTNGYQIAGSAAEVNSSVAASRGAASSATTTSAVSQPNVVGSAALTTLTASSVISTGRFTGDFFSLFISAYC